MSWTFGKEPQETLGQGADTRDMPYLTKSGFYEVEIANATMNTGVSKKNNKPWYSLSLSLCTIGTQPQAKLNISIFINETSQQLQDLLYFIDSRNSEGYLELPAPVHREGVSQSGNEYSFDSFPTLVARRFHAILEFKSMETSKNGNQYPVFDVMAILSDKGQTAAEHYNKLPCSVYKAQLAKLMQTAPAPQSAPVQQTQSQSVQRIQQAFAQPQPQAFGFGSPQQIFGQAQANQRPVNPDTLDNTDLPF